MLEELEAKTDQRGYKTRNVAVELILDNDKDIPGWIRHRDVDEFAFVYTVDKKPVETIFVDGEALRNLVERMEKAGTMRQCIVPDKKNGVVLKYGTIGLIPFAL